MLWKLGNAIVASTPSTTTAIINSTSVKPFCRRKDMWTLPSVLIATMGHHPAASKRRQDERSIRGDGRQTLDEPPFPTAAGAIPIAPARSQASTW